ncbi:MAG: GNAT family N-acetyltransferase [Fidelibacterota bacterium]|nr:MAG: GNAT family N-acetyltransferase [Candidatus Neomarinimicrobiota bacterium]
MSGIEVQLVRTARERRALLTFPWRIYRDDPLWVPPLLPERAKVIDPERGVFFQRGAAEFFLARRKGQPVGSICAAEDPPTNEAQQRRDCVIGFLEYIEDEEVFAALIETVGKWARERGLTALFGPFNLDYEDGYGVLVEGRDRPPALFCGHTPPYYQEFMERAGFEPARGDNLAFAIDTQAHGLPRIERLATRVRRQSRVTIRAADLDQWEGEIDRVHYLLNTALEDVPGRIPWQREALGAMLTPFRRIADPELVLFAEVEGETIGWLAGLPNLNEAFKHVNGLRYPWNYAQLWWRLKRRITSVALKSVLVIPEYWNKGVAILLFDEIIRRAVAKGITWADLSLTSDDNPHAPIIYHHIGGKIYKRYRVYRKAL